MNAEHRKKCVLAVLEVAAPHLATLSPIERADAYEGVSIIATDLDPSLSAKAAAIANHLRDGEIMQGDFMHTLCGNA